MPAAVAPCTNVLSRTELRGRTSEQHADLAQACSAASLATIFLCRPANLSDLQWWQMKTNFCIATHPGISAELKAAATDSTSRLLSPFQRQEMTLGGMPVITQGNSLFLSRHRAKSRSLGGSGARHGRKPRDQRRRRRLPSPPGAPSSSVRARRAAPRGRRPAPFPHRRTPTNSSISTEDKGKDRQSRPDLPSEVFAPARRRSDKTIRRNRVEEAGGRRRAARFRSAGAARGRPPRAPADPLAGASTYGGSAPPARCASDREFVAFARRDRRSTSKAAPRRRARRTPRGR